MPPWRGGLEGNERFIPELQKVTPFVIAYETYHCTIAAFIV
jgi:hypothetical protein